MLISLNPGNELKPTEVSMFLTESRREHKVATVPFDRADYEGNERRDIKKREVLKRNVKQRFNRKPVEFVNGLSEVSSTTYKCGTQYITIYIKTEFPMVPGRREWVLAFTAYPETLLRISINVFGYVTEQPKQPATKDQRPDDFVQRGTPRLFARRMNLVWISGRFSDIYDSIFGDRLTRTNMVCAVIHKQVEAQRAEFEHAEEVC